MEMICFVGNQEIQFPPAMKVQKIENKIEQSRVSNIPILQFTSDIINDILKSPAFDNQHLPESIIKEKKALYSLVWFIKLLKV